MESIISQLSGTATERRAQLAEVVIVPSGRGRLSHKWVRENISLAVADGIANTIEAVSKWVAADFVTGIGIDTTAATWKQQAELVSQSSQALAPHLETLRDFEMIRVAKWVEMGGTGEVPSVEAIQSAMDLIELDAAIAEQFNEVINPAKADANRTAATIAAALRSAADAIGGE